MTGYGGTKRTCRVRSAMSAFVGKAPMDWPRGLAGLSFQLPSTGRHRRTHSLWARARLWLALSQGNPQSDCPSADRVRWSAHEMCDLFSRLLLVAGEFN